jgi:CubicO group peptidase (beta-lactamase class C family)
MGEPELASLLREHASRHSVPGAAIGVLRDGVVATAYAGVASDHRRAGDVGPLRGRIAVPSWCATAVARLAEAGRLD